MTLEERKQRLDLVMSKVTRKGVDDLVDFLKNKSSFLEDPASGTFHNNYPGGLFDHSYNVTEYAMSIYNYTIKKVTLPEISVESIVLCSMCHDLCKIGTYKREKKWAKDNNGKWVQYECYGFEDKFPFGHGEKSAFMLQRFIDLTDEEALAIRFHMYMAEPGTHFFFPTGSSFNAAMEENTLVKLIQVSDLCAGMIEKKIDYKKEAGLM